MSLARTAEVLPAMAVSDHTESEDAGEACGGAHALPSPAPGTDPFVALVTRCRDGDEEAFARLVEVCSARLFNFLLRFAGNVHDAEDLAQETFLKAYRNFARFDVTRPFLPWLFTIARRTALNHLRAVRPTEELSEEVVAGESSSGVPDGAGATEALAARDDSDRLWHLARRLKPNQYQALWLRYGEGLELTEVASVMRTNALYVRVLLHRARRALLTHARRAGMGDPEWANS